MDPQCLPGDVAQWKFRDTAVLFMKSGSVEINDTKTSFSLQKRYFVHRCLTKNQEFYVLSAN